MSDENQPVALEGSTKLQPPTSDTPKSDDVDEAKQDDTEAKTEGRGEEHDDEPTPDIEGGEGEETKNDGDDDEENPPPKDQSGGDDEEDKADDEGPPGVTAPPEPEAKEEEENKDNDDGGEDTKVEDEEVAQPKITYVDPKPWMTPTMASERPVPSASQVSAVLAVQAGWRDSPAPKPEMRFFEYGDNVPKGVNPTGEQVEQLAKAIRDA